MSLKTYILTFAQNGAEIGVEMVVLHLPNAWHKMTSRFLDHLFQCKKHALKDGAGSAGFERFARQTIITALIAFITNTFLKMVYFFAEQSVGWSMHGTGEQMNRLTIRNSDGTVSQPTHSTFEKVFNRLSEYEDTGLEPDEILTCKELAEAAYAFILLKEYKSLGTIDHIRELLKAEQDGRLLVLPCKVGDTVYKLFDGKIREMRVVAIPLLISPGGAHLSVTSTNYRGAALSFELSDFGKTVFLTREEAEKALEG